MKIHNDKISLQEWKSCEKFFKSTNTGSIKIDNKVVEGLEAYATVGEDVSLLNIFFHSNSVKKVIRIQFDETDIAGNASKQEVYVLDYLEKLGFSMKNLEQLESNVKSNDFMETLAFIENKKSILPKSVNKPSREEKAIQKVLLGF
ncbi:MAG TPA: hypothetical protein PKC21_02165 [Oligoflexia bacterium]|nr:hypothetical protein [Oligoflexia bacterium]HMR24135.1 hypothetical protein [Oligoflexia bacterium]